MKKFNAKRVSIGIGYEFLNGKEVVVNVQALSTKEYEYLGAESKKSSAKPTQINENTLRKMLVNNDKKIVDEIVKEQYEEGVLSDFVNSLLNAVDESKKGKLND